MNPATANLAAALTERTQQTPHALALIQGERRVTFAELETLVLRGAACLHKAGLSPGDAVLVFQPVSVELYAALLAIFRFGMVAMFVDPAAGLSHLERCCRLGQPRGFLGPWKAHALRLASAALRGIDAKFLTGGCPFPLLGTVRWNAGAAPLVYPEAAPVQADTPALLTFTSGSTGQPKAAVRTHSFLRAQHRALHESLSLLPGEVDLSTLPIFVLANLASGVVSVLPEHGSLPPATFPVDLVSGGINAHRPTRSAASPAFFERLLDHSVPLAGFQKIYLGGAPVFPPLLARLRAATRPHTEITVVYGSTEAEPMAELAEREISADDHATMRGGGGLLAGQPVPSIRLRVIADHHGKPFAPMSETQFAGMICPTSTIGEIVVSGDHVLKGYLHGAGDEETKFRVGDEVWHRTGDAGKLDPIGRLWLHGRCAAKVVDQRGAQYSLAVECSALLQAPWAQRCAFLRHGGKRCLLVQPRSRRDFTRREKELAQLARQLAWAKVDACKMVRIIPVDGRHHAKIDYVALRKLYPP